MGNFTVPNPNGPPPKFPLSQLNPGPETPEDWDAFIRWLLLFWQNLTQVTQQLQTQQVLPPPSPLPFWTVRPAPRFITFEFELEGPNMQTNILPIMYPAATVPLALNIVAQTPHASLPGLYDIQTSADLVHWTSILQAPAQLAAGALTAATILLFKAGAALIPGQWIKALLAPGSDTSALQVTLLLEVA